MTVSDWLVLILGGLLSVMMLCTACWFADEILTIYFGIFER